MDVDITFSEMSPVGIPFFEHHFPGIVFLQRRARNSVVSCVCSPNHHTLPFNSRYGQLHNFVLFVITWASNQMRVFLWNESSPCPRISFQIWQTFSKTESSSKITYKEAQTLICQRQWFANPNWSNCPELSALLWKLWPFLEQSVSDTQKLQHCKQLANWHIPNQETWL